MTGTRRHLKGGETLPFDILVVAAGVRPNVELVKDAGGEVARGIVTDDRQCTSLPDVYAAGDCTESYDITSGTRKILALLPNAYFQGACAGANMAGAAETFDIAVPLNAVGFFGSHVLTAGTFDGEAYEEKGGDTYKKLFFKDGVLNGFILVNEPDRAGHLYLARAQQDAACGGGCGTVEKASRADGVLRGGAQGKTCKEGVNVWKS